MINENKKQPDEKKHQKDNTSHIQTVKGSKDNKIDQDFTGFPHGHAKENIINPKSDDEKKIADVDNKDGEKMSRKQIDESKSDGSAGAFSATEEVKE